MQMNKDIWDIRGKGILDIGFYLSIIYKTVHLQDILEMQCYISDHVNVL